MPGRGEVGIPAQLGIRHDPLEQLARHSVGDVELTGLQARHPGGQIPDAPDIDRLHARSSPPVLVPGLERSLHAGFLAYELERAGAHGTGFEAVLAHLLVIVPGNDPSDPAAGAAVEIEEVDERPLEVEDDRAVVHELDALDLVLEVLEAEATIVLVGPFHVGRRERMAVLEFQARAQAEGRAPEIRGHLGALGQAVGELPLRHRLDERVVDQIVEVMGRTVVPEGIEPSRIDAEVQPDVQGALRGSPPRRDLGVLDVELGQWPGQDRLGGGRRALARGDAIHECQ